MEEQQSQKRDKEFREQERQYQSKGARKRRANVRREEEERAIQAMLIADSKVEPHIRVVEPELPKEPGMW